MLDKRSRGRPRVLTDEERAANQIASRKVSQAKTRNLTIDKDLVEIINDYADGLEAEFGFRPTLSQALRVMLKRGVK
jgi:16S rRNA C1402 N4-methylase RsmH